ncbi:hypothetical protein CC86DRAFT_407703 [Ophiobolus disseminans]|uniref:Uncharacterized protein n=1 Tax=Ophiobolus disseminans TaxID=1469910 RepID=A0A6A6ZYA5_9PLEO|nr:hypothetical protein CC86DRAFT_407703 [Ophiobolus disseminans]
MFANIIITVTLALAAATPALADLSFCPSISTVPSGGCVNHCNVKFSDRNACKGEVNFIGACHERGRSDITLPVPTCRGFAVRYIVTGEKGAGTIQLINKSGPGRPKITSRKVGGCKRTSLDGAGAESIPCFQQHGTCSVVCPRIASEDSEESTEEVVV